MQLFKFSVCLAIMICTSSAAQAQTASLRGIIDGTTLDPNTLTIVNPFTQVLCIPQRRIRVSPRVDYQLTANDTLSRSRDLSLWARMALAS